MAQLFLAAIAAAFLSPVAAMAVGLVVFIRHRRRVEPARRMSAAVYILALVVSGAGAGGLGLFAGIGVACTGPKAGNLCGLWGVFITGPICAAIAMLAVAAAVSRRRSAT